MQLMITFRSNYS